MEFEEYLKSELAKPVSNKDYDPNGNSNRAVVVRGLLREVIWQYKAYPKRVVVELKCFDGMSTEIGWFVQLPIMIVFAPVLPIFAAKHWHNKSLGEYKLRWQRSKQGASKQK